MGERVLNIYSMCRSYYSPDGAKYRRSFNFVNDLICGEAAPKVLVSIIIA